MAATALALVLLSRASAAGEALRAHAHADLVDLHGQAAGQAEFSQTTHGVLVEFDLKGLPPGGHGVHIHGSGMCEPGKHFASAGPHFALEPRAHGYLARGGPHEGDLPNEFAASDGTLHASVITTAFTLGNGEKSIFTRNGAALIIDARADDYETQPDGNSGGRIACGVIVRTIAPGTRKGGAHRAHK